MFKECYTAGREASAKDTVKATWDTEQQSAGSDSRTSETDRFSAGAKYNSTNPKCQAAGNTFLFSIQKEN